MFMVNNSRYAVKFCQGKSSAKCFKYRIYPCYFLKSMLISIFKLSLYPFAGGRAVMIAPNGYRFLLAVNEGLEFMMI